MDIGTSLSVPNTLASRVGQEVDLFAISLIIYEAIQVSFASNIGTLL